MILFIDTETTGLPTRRNAHHTDLAVWPRIVSINWAIWESPENEVRNRYYLIRPDNFIIPHDATRIHGISTQIALRDGKQLRVVLKELLDDITRYSPLLIVAHNIEFDIPIVLSELHRAGLPKHIERMPTYCTMVSSTNYCAIPHWNRNGYKWPTLDELHKKLFGQGHEYSHDAKADLSACAKCFFRMQELGLE